MLATILVGAAAAISIPLIASNDTTVSRHAPIGATSSQTSGPNEATRGQAASSAVGTRPGPGTGGPNETARGQAVHSAAGGNSAPGPGGPNETARGQAVSSATK